MKSVCKSYSVYLRQFCIFCIFVFILHISAYITVIACYCLHSLKSDGKTAQNKKLVGRGFLHLVDHYFWYLPFASVKQGHAVREKACIPQDDWEQRWEAIVDEHDGEGARAQLISGWKTWLAERDAAGGPGGGPAPGAVHVVPIQMDDGED